MTGQFSNEGEQEARFLGVDAFIPKPVPLWELARLVQGWAQRSPRGAADLVLKMSLGIALRPGIDSPRRPAGYTTLSGAEQMAQCPRPVAATTAAVWLDRVARCGHKAPVAVLG